MTWLPLLRGCAGMLGDLRTSLAIGAADLPGSSAPCWYPCPDPHHQQRARPRGRFWFGAMFKTIWTLGHTLARGWCKQWCLRRVRVVVVATARRDSCGAGSGVACVASQRSWSELASEDPGRTHAPRPHGSRQLAKLKHLSTWRRALVQSVA